MGVLDMEGMSFMKKKSLCRASKHVTPSQAENADEWSYQTGLQGGWIPEDPTDRQYPGLCT